MGQRKTITRRATASLLAFAALGLALVAAGCGGGSSSSAQTQSTPGTNRCAPGSLQLVTPGQLTIGTDNPAYPPWYGGTPPSGSTWKLSDPTSGKGFESAVAYAVAKQLGFTRGQVKWTVVPFSQSFKPGPKSFDFDINQISYSSARAKAVDFSDSYYDVNQAIVALKTSKIANATSLAALKGAKLGAPIGTTSYQAIVSQIKTSQQPGVYDTLNDTIAALKAKQIDGLVVDLPTAFYITAAQVQGSKIVGQLPSAGAQHEHFGMVFGKGDSLVSCVNKALATLKANGTLAAIQKTWLSDKASAPILQ